MSNLNKVESSKDRVIVLSLWEDLLDSPIGGNDDPLRSDRDSRALNLRCEGIMICPLFEVMSEAAMDGTDIIYKDCLLALIPVPPFI